MVIALVLAGVACIIAAIVGGGVKLRDVEFPTVKSLWRQLMLGGFGVLLAFAGAVVASEAPPAPSSEEGDLALAARLFDQLNAPPRKVGFTFGLEQRSIQ